MTDSISNITTCLKQGQIVALIDDAADSPSAYLICASTSVTKEALCFLVNKARGLVCVALPESRIEELELPMMVPKGSEEFPDFTVSVEAREGVTTGISAADRVKTLRAIATTTKPRLDLVTPGHIFPIRAKKGGVLVRTLPAEAAVDLLGLANMPQEAVLCRCLDENGQIAGLDSIQKLCDEEQLPSIGISDIIRHRFASESIIELIAESRLPTKHAGMFRTYCFRSKTDNAEHLALVKGELALKEERGQIPVLARVQSANRISDLLGTFDCLGRQKLHGALKKIDSEGRGVFVYIRSPEKNPIKARKQDPLKEDLADSPMQQFREYGIGAHILSFLGVKRLRLLTNSEQALAGIGAFGLEIIERVNFEPSGEMVL